MNPLKPKELAQAYGLRYVDAEIIIRTAIDKAKKGLLALSALVMFGGGAALVCLFISPVPHDGKVRLILLGCLIVALTQQFIARRRARQPILDAAAARGAKAQNN